MQGSIFCETNTVSFWLVAIGIGVESIFEGLAHNICGCVLLVSTRIVVREFSFFCSLYIYISIEVVEASIFADGF